MAGIFHWIPLIYDTPLNNHISKTQFFLILLGVNITFFPQHFIGLNGLPRRYSDYPDAFSPWNFISSLGAQISTIAAILMIFIIWEGISAKRSFINFLYFPNNNEFNLGAPTESHTFLQTPKFFIQS